MQKINVDSKNENLNYRKEENRKLRSNLNEQQISLDKSTQKGQQN